MAVLGEQTGLALHPKQVGFVLWGQRAWAYETLVDLVKRVSQHSA